MRIQNVFGPISFYWTNSFFGPNICLGLGDFHPRQGIKPFQTEHFRLKSCFMPCLLNSQICLDMQICNIVMNFTDTYQISDARISINQLGNHGCN